MATNPNVTTQSPGTYDFSGGLTFGQFMTIKFHNGVRVQISKDYRDWEMVKQIRDGNPEGREARFRFQTSYGPAATQYRNPNFTKAYPKAQQITSSEYTAVYKELATTIMVEQNIIARLKKSGNYKYADALKVEMDSKMISMKRRMAADFYSDGSGIVGKSTGAATDAADRTTVTIAESTDQADFAGHIGFFEEGDLLLTATAAGALGTAPTFTASTTFYAWRIKSKQRRAKTVVLQPVDEDGVVLTDLTASNIDATTHFYRIGQPTIPDRTSVSDWGKMSEVIPGLESLTANDERVIHGITMDGANAGSVYNAGASAISTGILQSAHSDTKTRIGESYTWRKLCSSPEALDYLITSNEGDRRFYVGEDKKYGTKTWTYQHGTDSLEVATSEFTPIQRAYVLPENTSGEGKVLEFHGTDFEPVDDADGKIFHLEPNASGYNRRVVSFMQGYGTLICKHPAAITRIEDFAVTS